MAFDRERTNDNMESDIDHIHILLHLKYLILLKEEEVWIEYRLPYHITTFKAMRGQPLSINSAVSYRQLFNRQIIIKVNLLRQNFSL